MNRPVRARNAWLGLASVGACGLAVALGGLAPERFGPVPFFAAGLILTPASVIMTLVSQSAVNAMRRLARGEETIASWRVTPEEWRAFAVLNAEWHRQEGVTPNSLDLGQAAPDSGIEIVASPNSVRVGGDFHDLRQLATSYHSVKWLHTQPPAVELLGRFQTKSSSIPQALRIPVSVATQKAAVDLHAAWSYVLLLRNAGSGMFRNPVRVRNICAALAMAGLALLAVPFLSSGIPLTQMLISNLYGPMLALGFIAFTLCGVVALLLHFRDSKRYRAFQSEARVRWTITAEAWRNFQTFDRARALDPAVAFNFLSLPRKIPEAGVEVLAGERGLMVGGELLLFSVIASGGPLQPVWLDGPPLCMEIWCVFQTNGSSGTCTLRLPVDAAARPALEALCATWRGARAE